MPAHERNTPGRVDAVVADGIHPLPDPSGADAANDVKQERPGGGAGLDPRAGPAGPMGNESLYQRLLGPMLEGLAQRGPAVESV